ncbi:MAG: hypothetical protein M3276_10010 [Actinomycetota bacterium]|nr:hypothetical protein [Actinomycetota bacterium]
MPDSCPAFLRWCALPLAAGVLLAACAGDRGERAATTPTADASATRPTAPEAATDTAAGDSSPGQPQSPVTLVQVRVTGGQVQTSSQRVDVALDTTVRLEVVADVADDVHVHGYERHAPVRPGQPAVVSFSADIPGVFEVELEQAGLRLVELRVQ